MPIHKYRKSIVDWEYLLNTCIVTAIIEIKKWYGWVTIYTVEDDYDIAMEKCDEIINLLSKK